MKQSLWLSLVAILVLLASCGQEPETTAPSATPVHEKATAPAPTPVAARPGVTILAEGVIQAVQPPLPLAFESGGRLLAVHVGAGDLVQAGDLVATLDDTNAQDQVAQAQLSLQQAELALENLNREPEPAALASAQANLAAATSGLASAQSNRAALTTPPGKQQVLAAQQNLRGAKQALQDLLDLPDPDLVQISKSNLTAAEMQVQAAQAAYDQVAHLEYVGLTQQAMNLWQATTNYEQSQAEYNRARKGATADQLAMARAQVALAQADLDALQKGPEPETVAAAEAQVTAAEAQVKQAQAALDSLLAGPSAGDLEAAWLNVDQARLALAGAQRGLDNAELLAPALGTVIAVEAAPGALVAGGSPIIILLDTTQLEFHTSNLSERDLAQIDAGQTAVVTLKAYPTEPIEATVVRTGLQAGAPVGDAATFPVVLDLAETELDIRPGMTGRAEIVSN